MNYDNPQLRVAGNWEDLFGTPDLPEWQANELLAAWRSRPGRAANPAFILAAATIWLEREGAHIVQLRVRHPVQHERGCSDAHYLIQVFEEDNHEHAGIDTNHSVFGGEIVVQDYSCDGRTCKLTVKNRSRDNRRHFTTFLLCSCPVQYDPAPPRAWPAVGES